MNWKNKSKKASQTNKETRIKMEKEKYKNKKKFWIKKKQQKPNVKKICMKSKKKFNKKEKKTKKEMFKEIKITLFYFMVLITSISVSFCSRKFIHEKVIFDKYMWTVTCLLFKIISLYLQGLLKIVKFISLISLPIFRYLIIIIIRPKY